MKLFFINKLIIETKQKSSPRQNDYLQFLLDSIELSKGAEGRSVYTTTTILSLCGKLDPIQKKNKINNKFI